MIEKDWQLISLFINIRDSAIKLIRISHKGLTSGVEEGGSFRQKGQKLDQKHKINFLGKTVGCTWGKQAIFSDSRGISQSLH